MGAGASRCLHVLIPPCVQRSCCLITGYRLLQNFECNDRTTANMCVVQNIYIASPAKTEELGEKWLQFIFGEVPKHNGTKLVLCSAHFEDDDFVNFGEYSRGFASKLVLKPGIVPSRRLPTSPSAVKSDPDMEPRIGFIGAGNMAYGIAKGILSGNVLPVNVKVSAPSTRNFGRFEELGITVTHSNSEVVSGSDLVFLAVKPHLVPGVLSEISPLVTQKHIIVSVAAGITLATLELLLPAETVTLRLMPNLPCVLQEGALLFSRGPCAKPEHAALLSSLLQQCGLVEEGPEAWIDIHTGLSGSGVAFVYLFAEALAEGAVKMGMPSSLAHSITSQTIVGAGRLLRDSGKHPAQLRSDVCTPGGTTIYGLHALERGGLRAAAMGAVEAATQRATELGQKTAAAGSRK